jgi:hypothetical protein
MQDCMRLIEGVNCQLYRTSDQFLIAISEIELSCTLKDFATGF